jgi:hypothetical protein
MNDTLATLLPTWLFWWVLLFAAYIVLVVALDAVLAARKRRQHAQRRHRAELDRINRDTDVAVERIGAAFIVAQRLVRDEAAASRGDRR